MSHVYNLRPSLQWASQPETRLSAHPFAAANLPAEFIFGEDEPIDDQLQLGACTANMMDEIMWYMQEVLNLTPFHLSRLWQYYQERAREGTTASDAGASIADTVWVAQNMGIFNENQYPYTVSQFTTQPPGSLSTLAAKTKLIKSAMLQSDIATTKSWIFNGGGKPLPIAYGFGVYQQYETVGPDGMIAMPSGASLGGHANSKWGWSDSRQAWRVHNVWGSTSWGDHGKAWLPYSYPVFDHWGIAPLTVMPPTPVQVHASLVLTEVNGAQRRFTEA